MMRTATLFALAAGANAATVHFNYDLAMSVFSDAACNAAPISGQDACEAAGDCTFTAGATGGGGDDPNTCTGGGFSGDPKFDTPVEVTVGDSLHVMWTDPETVPAANTATGGYSVMVHDVTEMTAAQFATCDFTGLTPMTSMAAANAEACPGEGCSFRCTLTAGTDCSVADKRCVYTAPVAEDDATAAIELVAEACAARPRWKAVTIPFTEVGTRTFSCSVGSAINADTMGGAGDVQPWAHCSVFNQKLTVNVVAAAAGGAGGAGGAEEPKVASSAGAAAASAAVLAAGALLL